MEYVISKNEIVRRKKAYTTLTLSLIAGVAVGAAVNKIAVPGVVYLMLVIAMGLIGVFSFMFFAQITRLRIDLTSKKLIRKTGTKMEEYAVDEIVRVETKWTTNKTIRDMYLKFGNGQKVAITALERFEEFKRELENKLGKRVVTKERHERLDFDHPLFYVMLGLGLGVVSVGVFKLMTLINTQQMKMVEVGMAVYLTILGGYFVTGKPIARRSGNKTRYFDFVAGMTMWILGILVLGWMMLA